MNIMPVTSITQLEQLSPWLKSFDHESAKPIGKYHLFTKDERVLALTQQVAMTILFPAINPHVVTPRETTEIMDCFRAWSSNVEGGLPVAVPLDSHMNKHMSKLGYKPKCVLYEKIETSPQQ